MHLPRRRHRAVDEPAPLPAPAVSRALTPVLTTPIDALVAREVATVEGVVAAVTNTPVGHSPALHAVMTPDGTLGDGAGRLEVVWLGRRSLGGIAPGTRLRVHGRVCPRRASLAVYNPRYEIVAPDARRDEDTP